MPRLFHDGAGFQIYVRLRSPLLAYTLLLPMKGTREGTCVWLSFQKSLHDKGDPIIAAKTAMESEPVVASVLRVLII